MLSLDLQLRRGNFERHVRIEDTARVIALSGHSGAGKTSVLHAIAGLVRPRAGHIEIDGHRFYDSARGIDVPAHRRRVGYVFQDARLFPHLTVRRTFSTDAIRTVLRKPSASTAWLHCWESNSCSAPHRQPLRR